MAQAVSYIAGFETGDASEIAVLGTAASVQTSTKRSGAYALKIALDGSAPFTTLVRGRAASQVVSRVYIQFSGTPAGNPVVNGWRKVSAGALLALVYLDTTRKLHTFDSASTDVAGTTVLSLNTWYAVELQYDTSAGGRLRVLLNGTTEIDTTNTNNDGAGVADEFIVRADNTDADYYVDDVRVDVGGLTSVGAGVCIARQGKAGTPTYDAWTKNGAATAALCWSDTPFSTATNCSDLVLNDAQTMLVEKFSITQTGHGTETIATTDTINACKVSMIAKTAVAGNISLRRRVGGTDTDVTVALTTSDAYYDSGIFTDTAANLDAYEIGVKNALVATTETVEDMWMIVDYTAAVIVPFGWYRPLSEPRERLFNRGRPSSVASMAGAFSPPVTQSPVDTDTVRWHRPFSEPRWPKRDPRYEADFASGTFTPPVIQPAFDNANARWFTPLSLPVRERLGARGAAFPPATMVSGPVSPPAIQPDFDNANVRWHRPFSEPHRFKRDLTYETAFAAGAFSPPAIQPDFDNRNVRWYAPLSEPRRESGFMYRLAGEISWPIAASFIVVPVPAYDWYRPLEIPQKFLRDPRYQAVLGRLGEAAWPQIQPAFDNANLNWHRPFSEPQRFLRDLRFAASLDASGEVKWPYAQPAEDNANVRWYQPLSEPRRFLRDLRWSATLAASGATQWPYAQPAVDAATVRWYQPLREPQRWNRDPRYAATLAAGPVQAAIIQPAFDNASVRWMSPLSEPRREYRFAARIAGEISWPLKETLPAPSPVNVAMWFVQWQQPLRVQPRYEYQAVFWTPRTPRVAPRIRGRLITTSAGGYTSVWHGTGQFDHTPLQQR